MDSLLSEEYGRGIQQRRELGKILEVRGDMAQAQLNGHEGFGYRRRG